MTGHLIHIGYPKAGSTYLQRWFEAHPQIAYVEGGIAGLRFVYDVASEAAGPDQAVRWRVTSSEALVAPRPNAAGGKPFFNRERRAPLTDEQEKAAGLLASLFPNAAILIVTRGFRSMILSAYSQHVRTGGSRTLDQLAADGLAEHAWDYDRLIGVYRARFGDDRVIVLPFELLEADEARFTGELERRLGLDPQPAARERINAALSPAELAWYPRLARAADRLPAGRGRAKGLLAEAAFSNRLRRPIALLQRLRPQAPVTAASVRDEALEAYRGKADSLREDPLFAPFAKDYLFSPAP
jgi:hypothetical protein